MRGHGFASDGGAVPLLFLTHSDFVFLESGCGRDGGNVLSAASM
jgi:hypothetical protein